MLEIPEAIVIAAQLNQTIKDKRIKKVIAAASPHKFAWFFGDPSQYHSLLFGRKVENTTSYGGRVEINAEGIFLHFGDGVNLRYYAADEIVPQKHQLFVAFEDGSALVGTVAMYGGLWCFTEGAFDDNDYYKAAKKAVSPLSDRFDYEFFLTLFDQKGMKMSAKGFLATGQRIPGLGNGVLQDILLNAGVHPKRKMNTLLDGEKRKLFDSLKATLAEMVEGCGRDTERDLFGNWGGYKTKMSKNTVFCSKCGCAIKKETYMGGSIYYCEHCQKR